MSIEAGLAELVAALRRSGVPVSLAEHQDARAALLTLPLADPAIFRAALASCLVKQQRHAELFDAAFARVFAPPGRAALAVALSLDAALRAGDRTALREHAIAAVAAHADIAPGQNSGAAYHLGRVLRALDFPACEQRLLDELAGPSLGRLLAREALARQCAAFRAMLADEIAARLARQPGRQAPGAGGKDVTEIGFQRASPAELREIGRAVRPLGRALAARLARRRRWRRGGLDFRATLRASMAFGGVPVATRFRHRRPGKPEIFVLADASASVAGFAGFTLAFLAALAEGFSSLRAWRFIDRAEKIPDPRQAISLPRLARGRTDYGRMLAGFAEAHAAALGSRSTLLILGDARSNHRPPEAAILAELRRRAGQVFWLNPEPRSNWDRDDSIIAAYAPHCDAVFECGNLKQLQAAVAAILTDRRP